MQSLLILAIRLGIRHNPGTNMKGQNVVLNNSSTNCYTELTLVICTKVANCSCIESPGYRFKFSNHLKGSALWGTTDGTTGKTCPKGIYMSGIGTQPSLDSAN